MEGRQQNVVQEHKRRVSNASTRPNILPKPSQAPTASFARSTTASKGSSLAMAPHDTKKPLCYDGIWKYPGSLIEEDIGRHRS